MTFAHRSLSSSLAQRQINPALLKEHILFSFYFFIAAMRFIFPGHFIGSSGTHVVTTALKFVYLHQNPKLLRVNKHAHLNLSCSLEYMTRSPDEARFDRVGTFSRA